VGSPQPAPACLSGSKAPIENSPPGIHTIPADPDGGSIRGEAFSTVGAKGEASRVGVSTADVAETTGDDVLAWGAALAGPFGAGASEWLSPWQAIARSSPRHPAAGRARIRSREGT